MFNRKRKDEVTGLDQLIDEVQLEMRTMNVDTDQFKLALARLKELCKLRDESRPSRVSPDTLAIVGANLLGILIITQHERANVVTSKAVGFVQKLR